jgi:hypothetical protein
MCFTNVFKDALILSFAEHKFLILVKSNLQFLFFSRLFFVLCVENHCLTQATQILSYVVL